MRIGIDGSAMLKQPTGIGRYIKCLIESLARNAPEVELVVFTFSYKDTPPGDWFAEYPNVSVVHKRWPGRAVLWLWEHLRWPNVEAAIGSVDIFHSPNNNVAPQRAGKSVTTIHDLFFLEHPERTHKTGGQYYFRVLPRVIHKADHVIAVSEATAEGTRRAFSIPPERISVIHQGVEERFFRNPQPPTASRQLPTDEPYVLHIGTIEPRKGIDTLLSAMEHLWGERNFKGSLVALQGRGCP
ncbi:glycosyltransferase family 4 protein [bacterium]|nr:glycosyltransferase family 4 protein [bacterium]